MTEIDTPLVSAIIPCRNEERYIARCLESILANDYPREKLEIFVVNGMSEDRTREIIEELAKRYNFVRLLDNPRKITPISMNLAIRQAKGDVIIKMDAHTIYEKDYISKCVRYLGEYGADNVGGILITCPGEDRFVARAIAICLSHPFGVGDSYFRIGTKEPRWVDTVSFGCYKREVFDKVGLYDERLARSQDLELNLRLKRAGGKILLVPIIVGRYYAQSSFGAFAKYNFWNGFWVLHPLQYGCRAFSWRHLVPFIFVLSLTLSAALSFVFSPFFWLFLSILGSYSMANIYWSIAIAARDKDARSLLLMPIVFAALHLGYGFGSLYGLLNVLMSTQFWQNRGRVSGPDCEKPEMPVREADRMDILKSPKSRVVKRILDFTCSFMGLVALSPMLAAIALWIKLDSKGPVFYRSVRVGRHGTSFRIFKYRTMVVNAEEIGGSSTPEDDPRITRVGKFLRRYKLDEFPQLINVMRGEMSLVGPRPQVPWAVDLYNKEEKALLSVCPGITDYASIRFRNEADILRGSVDPDKDYLEKIAPEKIRLGLDYVRNHTLWIDLRIIVASLWALTGANPEWILRAAKNSRGSVGKPHGSDGV